MWSEAPDPGRLRGWVEALRRVLPEPRSGAEQQRTEVSSDCPTAVAAGRARARRGVVWLDGGSRRRHLLACEPLVELRCTDRTASVRGPGGEAELECDGFGLLQAAFAAWGRAGHGRLFGFLGYELGGKLEGLPPPPAADLAAPDLWLGLHDQWLEHEGGEWTVVSSDGWRAEPPSRLLDLVGPEVAGRETEAASTRRASPVQSAPDSDGFEAAVARTVRRIHAGEVFQANVCRRFSAAVSPGCAWDLFLALRARGDVGQGAFLDLGDVAVISRSPELFLRCRSRTVQSDPIKGTRARGDSPADDLARRESLLASAKDRAELAMIVDLVRNDLGRVCVPGSVEVVEFPSIMELETIWHTWARVRGRLRDDVSAVQLLRATFPPGSITGAPKIQAMVVAGEEEPHRRGPAMGALGWLDLDGDLELSVAIRTAVVGGDRVVYHAGCGIVADSDPRLEQEESLVKARDFLAAIEA